MKKIIKITSGLICFAVFAFVLYSCIEGQVVIHGTIDRYARGELRLLILKPFRLKMEVSQKMFN